MHHIDWLSIIPSVASVAIVGLLSLIGRSMKGMRADFRRFMAEHLFLLRVADWTTVNLPTLFDHLGLTPTEPPPVLPREQKR